MTQVNFYFAPSSVPNLFISLPRVPDLLGRAERSKTYYGLTTSCFGLAGLIQIPPQLTKEPFTSRKLTVHDGAVVGPSPSQLCVRWWDRELTCGPARSQWTRVCSVWPPATARRTGPALTDSAWTRVSWRTRARPRHAVPPDSTRPRARAPTDRPGTPTASVPLPLIVSGRTGRKE